MLEDLAIAVLAQAVQDTRSPSRALAEDARRFLREDRAAWLRLLAIRPRSFDRVLLRC